MQTPATYRPSLSPTAKFTLSFCLALALGAPVARAGLTLGEALNATNLTWTTSGDANWFGQTALSHDATSSARSGVLTNVQTSTLQTTVTGPGMLAYWWQNTSSDGAFHLAFELDGAVVTNLSYPQAWVQVGPVAIGPGTHTLAWVASAGGSSDTNGAGYVDQVLFAPPVYVTDLQLTIARHASPLGEYFDVIPWLYAITPPPATLDTVESPTGLLACQVGSFGRVGSSPRMPTLDAFINECTNGYWTLIINQGAMEEQRYTFRVSITGLTTNLLGQVSILSPLDGSTELPPQPPLSWSGPSDWSSVFAIVDSPMGDRKVFPNSATNWPSPPILSSGTNSLYVQYSYTNFPGVTFTTPVDSLQVPIAAWNASGTLQSDATSQFVVSPAPVQLLNVAFSAKTFSFQFQTQAGRSYTIQARTNLLNGNWVDLTNFSGNGSLHQLTFTTTNSPVRFFRVRSQ